MAHAVRKINNGYNKTFLVLTYSHRKKCPCLITWALLIVSGAGRDFISNYDIIKHQ